MDFKKNVFVLKRQEKSTCTAGADWRRGRVVDCSPRGPGFNLQPIHGIPPYFRGISLFLTKFSYFEFQNFPIYILYISVFQINKFLLFNHSLYLEREISLFGFSRVSHVCLSLGAFPCDIFSLKVCEICEYAEGHTINRFVDACTVNIRAVINAALSLSVGVSWVKCGAITVRTWSIPTLQRK